RGGPSIVGPGSEAAPAGSEIGRLAARIVCGLSAHQLEGLRWPAVASQGNELRIDRTNPSHVDRAVPRNAGLNNVRLGRDDAGGARDLVVDDVLTCRRCNHGANQCYLTRYPIGITEIAHFFTPR